MNSIRKIKRRHGASLRHSKALVWGLRRFAHSLDAYLMALRIVNESLVALPLNISSR